MHPASEQEQGKGAGPKSGGGSMKPGLEYGLDYKDKAGSMNSAWDYRSKKELKSEAGSSLPRYNKGLTIDPKTLNAILRNRNSGQDYQGQPSDPTTLQPGPTTPKEKDEQFAEISCGGHDASSCAGCPQGNGAAWCGGECTWSSGSRSCIALGGSGSGSGSGSGGVSCGNHRATSCSGCPQGNGEGWCHGD